MDKVSNGAVGQRGRNSEMRMTDHFFAVLFLCLVTFAAYMSSLHGTWAMDDTVITQYANVGDFLNLKLGYRKVAYLSFLINLWINPHDPLNFRVVNILIHIINSVLVYSIAFLTLRLPGWAKRYGSYAFPVAMLSSVIFALHPLNINAVSYIVQRMASLSALFVMLALLCYIYARRSSGRGRSAVFYGFAMASIFLGIFSKENGIMALPLILLYEYIFLRESSSSTGFYRKLFTCLAIGFVAAIFLSFSLGSDKNIVNILNVYLNMDQPIPAYNWTAQNVYWTPIQHFLTEFRVIGRYLFLFIIPLPRFLVFDWWDFPLSYGITEPVSTAVSMAIILGAISFAVFKIKKIPFLSFAVLWYFIAISLESFVAVGSDLYFEHRNYLPLTGFLIGITAQGIIALKGKEFSKRTVWIIVLIVTIPLGAATFQRNKVWADSISLWTDTLSKAPGNPRAMIALGNSYLKLSNFDAAARYFEDAAKKSYSSHRVQFFEEAVYSLGMVSLFKGDLKLAGKVIEIMDTKMEGSLLAPILKGFYSSLNDDLDGAIMQYNKILPELSGLNRVVVFTLLGDAYMKKALPENALESYRKAIEIDPSFAAAYYGISAVYLSTRNLDEAVGFLEKTLAIDPHNPLALSDMADIMMAKKDFEKAMSYAQAAVSNTPSFYQPYLVMGSVLTVRGAEEKAEEYYSMARERGLKDYLYLFSKARAYYLRGDNDKARSVLVMLAKMKDVPENMKEIVTDSLNRK